MAKMDLVQQLSQSELFSKLAPDEVLAFSSHCRIRHIRRSETLFHSGDAASSVYVVMFGSVKLVRSNAEGKERIVHLLLRGEMFGAAVALQPGGAYPVTAIGLEHTGLIEISGSVFKNVFMKHPKIGQTLVSQMSERIQQAHNDRVMSFDSVDKRIAAFLMDLLQRSCERFGKTTRIPVPLTRQDIADRVGTTVETVIRTLSDWTKAGLVTTESKQIEIPNIDAFCHAVDIVSE
jgi:CRP-like cAMP-binding protein